MYIACHIQAGWLAIREWLQAQMFVQATLISIPQDAITSFDVSKECF
jgi:hypothetical protein